MATLMERGGHDKVDRGSDDNIKQIVAHNKYSILRVTGKGDDNGDEHEDSNEFS